MIAYVAIAAVTALAFGYGLAMQKSLARLSRGHEKSTAAWERERRELLNRIMYMEDRPWSPPDLPPNWEEAEEPEAEYSYPEGDVLYPSEVL